MAIRPEAEAIINKYKSSSPFLFPVFTSAMSEEDRNKARKNFTRVINDRLKEMSEELEIELKITTYVSRHTYATTLKRAGVNTSFISDALGHNDEKTTQIYLDSIENTELDEIEKDIL
jgi:site-specific recombinase XerD